MLNSELAGPLHEPGLYNIDAAIRDGRWACVGNRNEMRDALSIARKEASLTGRRYRVCAPDGKVVFDTAALPAASTQSHAAEATAEAKALKLDYSLVVDECYRIPLDHLHQLAVVGDVANACYEWVIEKQGKIVAHSNVGYGDSSIALRDGLIAYYGLGDVLEPVEFSSDSSR